MRQGQRKTTQLRIFSLESAWAFKQLNWQTSMLLTTPRALSLLYGGRCRTQSSSGNETRTFALFSINVTFVLFSISVMAWKRRRGFGYQRQTNILKLEWGSQETTHTYLQITHACTHAHSCMHTRMHMHTRARTIQLEKGVASPLPGLMQWTNVTVSMTATLVKRHTLCWVASLNPPKSSKGRRSFYCSVYRTAIWMVGSGLG